MNSRAARRIVAGVALGLLVLFAFLAAHGLVATPLPVLREGIVQIAPGLGLEGIAVAFFGREAFYGQVFKVYVVLTGNSRKLKAGEYLLAKDSIRSLAKKLAAGKVYSYRVTLTEGIWAADIAELLSGAGLGDRDRFLALIHDPVFVRQMLGYDAPSLEGYLFPETYFFTKNMSEKDILKVFVQRFKAKTGLMFQARPAPSGAAHDVMILASMVEREAQAADERPIIAGVFLNRLKKHMPLESCVTVEYALGEKKKRLTDKDLEVSSPYNTYRHQGFPPGPVSNPGLAAIRAVLAPADTTALFFVAQGNGRHIFSENWAAHKLAKKKVKQQTGRSRPL